MIDLRERRRQLLNLTITEIILILLFLILLITASLIQKNKKLTEQNEAYKSLDVDVAQLVQLRKFDIRNITDDKVVVLIGKRDTGKSFLCKEFLFLLFFTLVVF